MTPACATVIGTILQLLGAGYLVVNSWRTTQKLGKFGEHATYNNFTQMIETLAREIAGQFKQQLIGFVCLLVGSFFQLYAVLAT